MIVVKKPTPKEVGPFTFFIVAIILLGLIFVIDFFRREGQLYDDRVSNFVESLVPEQATDVRYIVQSAFQSSRLKIRFTIPASSLSDFIEDFCPGMKLIDGGYISIYNDESMDWWRPEDAQIYSIGGCVQNNIEVHRVLIDKTNPQEFLVYIRA